jgi:O-antigen/teichoic acid export membrane protein
MKDIIKGSSIVFFYKILGASFLFLSNIIISRFYGTEGLGIYNLLLILFSLAMILSRLGLNLYAIRVLPSIEDDKDKVSGFLVRIFKIVIVSSLLVSTIFYFSIDIIDQYIFRSIDAGNYLLWLVFFIFPYTLFNIFPEIFRGFNDIKMYSFFRNLSQNFIVVFLLLLGIFFFSKKPDPIYVLYIGILILVIIEAITLEKFIRKKGIKLKWSSSSKYTEKIIPYSYPMLLTASIMFAMSYADSLMISYFLGESQVGIYSACLRISFAAIFVLSSVGNFLLPKISKEYSLGNLKEVKSLYIQSVKVILIFTMPIICILLIFPDFFLGLFGEEYKVAVNTLTVTLVAFLISAFFGPTGHVLNMMDEQKFVYKTVIFSLILNLILNFILIAELGIIGAAIATLISKLVWNGILYYRIHQKIMIIN